MKDPGSLLIRADADPQIGSGHVMRCLALAEAWQDCGGTVIFVLAGSSAIEQRLVSEKMGVRHIASEPGSSADADETVRIARDTGASWIVLDGYQFGSDYQKTIKDSGQHLLCIDDYGHARHYLADLVLNQNSYADMTFYPSHDSSTRFLLGSVYTLLRREFRSMAGLSRVIPDIGRKVLVMFGGGDPENCTLNVIRALALVPVEGIEVIVVVGGVNARYESLCRSIEADPRFSVRKNVTDIPELMVWADLAISAGGSTAWELCFMGLPAILHPIAENQEAIVNDLHAKGCAAWFGNADPADHESMAKIIHGLLISRRLRLSLHTCMKELVDGNGACRTAALLMPPGLHMRRVRHEDCDLIYRWINDPVVRANSFSPEKISRDEHNRWFASVLADPMTIYYIAEDGKNNPVGQARFRIGSEDAVISVLVGADYRGKRMGSALIRLATRKCFEETGIRTIHAYIKPKNPQSHRSFISAGYTSGGIISMDGQDAYHLIKSRDEP